MSRDLMRQMLDDALPPGLLWEPEEEEKLDQLLDGIADNMEFLRAFLVDIKDIRNPNKTTILSDLEKEYGIPTNSLISEATRRQRLAQLAYREQGTGTIDDLQNVFDNSGFNVFVYDPAVILDQLFQMVAGGGNAYAGRDDAFAGRSGGVLLVNGEIFKTRKIFTSVAGTIYAGIGHGAGEYDDVIIERIEYPIPTEAGDWPFVFFVGGTATYGYIDLISNGGFETGSFSDWTQNNSTIDNINPASGTYCSKLVAIGADLLGAESISYDIDPLRLYTVKIKNDVTAYTAGNYKNILEFRDADDMLISSITLLDKTAVTSGYEQLEKTIGYPTFNADYDIPISARKIRIRHEWDGTPTGTAFMDDVELYRSDKQSITAIANATVDGTREDEFLRLILKYKPLHSWAALVITFT